MLPVLGAVLVTVALAHLAAVLAVALRADPARPTRRAGRTGLLAAPVVPVVVGSAVGVGLVQVVLPHPSPWPGLVAGALLSAACAAYARARPALHGAGAVLWLTWLALTAAAAVWTAQFLSGLSLSAPTTALLWLVAGLGALTLPSSVVTTREGWEPLLRRGWARRRAPLAGLPARPPRVSVQVPCHAEPPEIVIATLDRLAALDYPSFEVLVIDNNTADPALWQPVREHCAVLGRRFRFLHVEGITGAKAGALNWALPHADPAAELIAVVDADYHVAPDWLRRTVGYFDEPRTGFVQCPHAYRDYQHSRFGRWASWEYAVFFRTGMVSLDEHGAGLTVGTMSLVRRRALEEVGGWAEWCLTEDSELAIRIHAAGYDSVYLTEPYGRGLIPETFTAYARQRFRWTYGPVQELRRHWRLFLPRWLGATPSRLTPAQKLHHANHGLDVMSIGVRALAVPLGVAGAASMLLHDERVPVPVELWTASTAVLGSSLLVRYLVYTRIVGATLRQALGGTLAFAALSFVITVASLRGTLGSPATWQRTDKFRTAGTGLRVLRQVRTETSAGLACLVAAGLLLALAPLGGVVTMVAVALVAQGSGFFAATGVAVVADRALPRQPVSSARPPAADLVPEREVA